MLQHQMPFFERFMGAKFIGNKPTNDHLC